jgi:hypothetical protein
MAIAISRSDWGAVGTVPKDSTPKTELAVHHTVGANREWSKAEEREHMRALERQHISQGWSTIGYSWVIFPSGRAYTGRGFRGLPAAQGGQNSGTWAIAFVGTFTDREPTKEARLKLREFIERLLDYSKGRLRELGGHREFPLQQTECPGDGLMEVVRRNRERYRLGEPR